MRTARRRAGGARVCDHGAGPTGGFRTSREPGRPRGGAREARRGRGRPQAGGPWGRAGAVRGGLRPRAEPEIFYDFGLAYLGLGRRGEALSAFERFLAEAPDAAADKRDLAARQVAALRPRVGALIITGLPAGATIVIDDREVGKVPLPGPLYLNPGPHEITARLSPGVTGPAVRVEVTAGASLAVTLASPSYPRPPAAAPPRADSSPVARVDLVPGETHTSGRRVAAIASGAAGLALIAAGVTFGVLARREGDSLTRDSENGTTMPTPFDPSKESRGTTYATLQAIRARRRGAGARRGGRAVFDDPRTGHRGAARGPFGRGRKPQSRLLSGP